jgi:hypothetical protein
MIIGLSEVAGEQVVPVASLFQLVFYLLDPFL